MSVTDEYYKDRAKALDEYYRDRAKSLDKELKYLREQRKAQELIFICTIILGIAGICCIFYGTFILMSIN